MRFMKDVMRWVFFFGRVSSTVFVLVGRCLPTIPMCFLLSPCVNLVHQHAVLEGGPQRGESLEGASLILYPKPNRQGVEASVYYS